MGFLRAFLWFSRALVRATNAVPPRIAFIRVCFVCILVVTLGVSTSTVMRRKPTIRLVSRSSKLQLFGTCTWFASLNFFLFVSAVDLTFGVVYCFSCGDYVYEERLEQILGEEKAKGWKSNGMYFFSGH